MSDIQPTKGSLEPTAQPTDWVKLIGYAEGVSFLVLLAVAVPLKYLAQNPLLVRITGPIHGALFVVYVIGVVVSARPRGWSMGQSIFLIGAAFLPLGPFFAHARTTQSKPTH